MMTEPRPKHAVLRAVPLIAAAVVAAFIGCDAAGDATGASEELRSGVTPQQGTFEYVGEQTDVDASWIDNDLLDASLFDREQTDAGPDRGVVALREIAATEAARRAHAEADGAVAAGGGTLTLREVADEAAPQRGHRPVDNRGEGGAAATRDREQREVRLRAAGAGRIAALIDDGVLIYVDGVRIDSHSDPVLQELNPNDIDRIEVVRREGKAGGVVRITTTSN